MQIFIIIIINLIFIKELLLKNIKSNVLLLVYSVLINIKLYMYLIYV